MTKKYEKLAEKFIDEHDSDRDWPPLDRFERLAIEMFVEWLDKRSKKKPAEQPKPEVKP